MKTKLITLLLCLCPLLLIAQDYKKEGDELFQQGQYEKAIKKYNAYIAFAGEDAEVSMRVANAQKCNILLRRAKSAEQAAAESSNAAKYEEASRLYHELYSVHPLPFYKSKATQLHNKIGAVHQERERAAQAEREREAKRLYMEAIHNGFVQGHACVDLGLSVAWATCNIGASNPGEAGKTIKENEVEKSNNWEGKWRVPSMAECLELKKNCTMEPVGWPAPIYVQITSKINGKSILIPYYYRLWTSDFDVKNARQSFHWNEDDQDGNPNTAESYEITIRCVIPKE